MLLRPLRHSLYATAHRRNIHLYSNYQAPDLDENELNNTLHSLVASGQFSAAERLRLKIVSNGLHIYPKIEYANVALACLRNRRLSGASGIQLTEYLTWLNLVPDRERLHPSSSHSPTKPTSPFDAVVHDITYRASIPSFHPFLTETGVVLASKGFTRRHFLTLARPIIIHSRPTSPSLIAFAQMERRAVDYERLRDLPRTGISKFIQSSLIQLFAQRGWLWKSVDLVLAQRNYPFPDAIYQLVLDGISNTRQVRKKDMILKRWEKDKAFLLHGIKK